MSIQISNLTKKYGSQTVLNNINIEIGAGEIVGFLGPNGAGKTTAMRIIAGVLPYASGSVRVCNTEVAENSIKTRKLIGYLPEHNPLYADMYVKEYLNFAAESYGIKGKKFLVDELIEKTGLRPEFHKKIGQLSKGYRQRVGLAQALIHNPEVLILDEPATGLDPNQLDEIRTLIRETGKNKTVLLSTHIMQEIKAICSRVIIINKGETVADYPDISKISSFDENIQHFEVEFLSEISIENLKQNNRIISVSQISGNTFSIAADDDIRAAVFDFAVASNNKILSMKTAERSMEEVFRSLTR
jgi:ABC-2 type transport system ATP-binding protein